MIDALNHTTDDDPIKIEVVYECYIPDGNSTTRQIIYTGKARDTLRRIARLHSHGQNSTCLADLYNSIIYHNGCGCDYITSMHTTLGGQEYLYTNQSLHAC